MQYENGVNQDDPDDPANQDKSATQDNLASYDDSAYHDNCAKHYDHADNSLDLYNAKLSTLIYRSSVLVLFQWTIAMSK